MHASLLLIWRHIHIQSPFCIASRVSYCERAGSNAIDHCLMLFSKLLEIHFLYEGLRLSIELLIESLVLDCPLIKLLLDAFLADRFVSYVV